MSTSRISLEPSELSGTEACASVEREDELDAEMVSQQLVMTPAEMEALYHGLTLYREQGIWSTRTVER